MSSESKIDTLYSQAINLIKSTKTILSNKHLKLGQWVEKEDHWFKNLERYQHNTSLWLSQWQHLRLLIQGNVVQNTSEDMTNTLDPSEFFTWLNLPSSPKQFGFLMPELAGHQKIGVELDPMHTYIRQAVTASNLFTITFTPVLIEFNGTIGFPYVNNSTCSAKVYSFSDASILNPQQKIPLEESNCCFLGLVSRFSTNTCAFQTSYYAMKPYLDMDGWEKGTFISFAMVCTRKEEKK